MQFQTRATECKLREEGLYLTFSDGKSFLYPLAFLFATRFTHAKAIAPEPVGSNTPGNSTGAQPKPSFE